MGEILTTTYFSALHDETYALLVEARNYIASLRHSEKRPPARYADKLDLTLETMRLTSRLTQVMAWILAQKAVQNGEISSAEGASPRFALSGRSVCMETAPEKAAHLPPHLRDMLRRSYDLYCRVGRLERQIQERLTGEVERTANPLEDGPFPRPVRTSDQSPRNVY